MEHQFVREVEAGSYRRSQQSQGVLRKSGKIMPRRAGPGAVIMRG
jgi:hypothetical protein